MAATSGIQRLKAKPRKPKATVDEGALDAVPILVQSYGELTPVGCNETPAGRQLNRRVEVWVRDKRG